jgi:acyl-CoA synthetase (AMP-forming)/AMP-acid ligase II
MVLSQLSQLERGYRRDCNAAGISSSGSWLPFHHDMGLFIGLLFPLFTRCANVLASPRFYMHKPKRWFALQAGLSVEWNFSTNLAMASSLVSLGQLAPGSLDLSRFFLYLCAEKVSPLVLRRSREALGRLGMPADHLRVGYGLAENTLGAASTRGYPDTAFAAVDGENRVHLSGAPSDGAVEIASVGRPHLDTTITVRDDQGRVLPELTLGELCIEGPCVTPGYYRDAQATSRAVAGGVLHTRDLGFRRGEDLFFFARKDDLLVVGGRNIAPDDVEDYVESIAGVEPGSAVLIDVPDGVTGKTDLVLLVGVGAGVSDEETARRGLEIRSRVLAQRGVLLNRVAFAARNALEKTSSGKKRRRVIRERFMRHELALR